MKLSGAKEMYIQQARSTNMRHHVFESPRLRSHEPESLPPAYHSRLEQLQLSILLPKAKKITNINWHAATS